MLSSQVAHSSSNDLDYIVEAYGRLPFGEEVYQEGDIRGDPYVKFRIWPSCGGNEAKVKDFLMNTVRNSKQINEDEEENLWGLRLGLWPEGAQSSELDDKCRIDPDKFVSPGFDANDPSRTGLIRAFGG